MAINNKGDPIPFELDGETVIGTITGDPKVKVTLNNVNAPR